MDDRARLAALIGRARRGDVNAFGRLVRDFQDMAVGYALSLLGDVHAAEDAAQEAFLTAFQKLGDLRETSAFPGWFRAVVRTACVRMRRVNRLETVPLSAACELAGGDPMPMEQDEHGELLVAVRSLPETERSVLTLFYMSEYSHKEIAAFLGVAETTVQGRLRTGRARLRERMLKMAEENLRREAPSRDSRFEDRVRRLVRPEELKSDEEQPWNGGRGVEVWEMMTATIRGDLETIQRLAAKDPRLVNCSHQSRSPLHFAVQENRVDVVKFLLEQRADPTFRSGNPWHERPVTIAEERGYTVLKALLEAHLAEKHRVSDGGERIAEAIREWDVDRVRAMLDAEPALIEAGDARGNLPIHWAALTRNMKMVDLLLERGADINAMRPDGARPLDLTNGDYWYRKNRDVPKVAVAAPHVFVGYLVAKGANYDICVAAMVGDTERVQELLEQDPGLANRAPDYCTYS